ncbi:MAG: hypothetical protein S4CHLAM6_13750 [Chlamydiae bacterium]|nr:hypothetical protein [Chlamydiota bacterium]
MTSEPTKIDLVKDVYSFSNLNVMPGEKFRKYYYCLPSNLSSYELSQLDETVANYTSKKISLFSKYTQDSEVGELFKRHIFVLNVFKNLAIMKYKPEPQQSTYEKLAATVLPLAMSYVSFGLVSKDRPFSPFIATAINSFSALMINHIWFNAEKRILSEEAKRLLESPVDIKIDENGILLNTILMKGSGVARIYYKTKINLPKKGVNSLDFAVSLNNIEAEDFLKKKSVKLVKKRFNFSPSILNMESVALE